MKEMISVIIPIHNMEEYLAECIESVLNQSYKNYEVILVNDDSTDRSEEIAREYTLKYKNITLINTKVRGLSAARNFGLKHVNGEYICFLDSDDKICSNLFKKCIENFKGYDVDMVHFGYEAFNNNGTIRRSELRNTGKVMTGAQFFKNSAKYTLGQNFEACTYMYKKEFWMSNKFEFKEGIVYEDAEFFVRILMRDPKIIIINEHLYLYRRREGSITKPNIYGMNYLYSTNIIINSYLDYMYKHPELEYEFKKFIARLIRVKFDVLLNIKEIDSCVMEKELKDILDLKNKLGFEIDSIYITKIKDSFIAEGKDIRIFDNKEIKDEIAQINSLRKDKVAKIPFNEEKKKIGIYGLGNHTKKILKYYEKNIGFIKAEIYLIDSILKESFLEEYNMKLINVSNVNKYNLDCILISAPYSEKILYDNLIKFKYSKKIYRLYDDNEKLLFL